MPNYIATFHTHLAAMRSLKNVKGHAASAALSPVPRRGTAVPGFAVAPERKGGCQSDN